jgi:hypothetical protein
MSLTILLIEEAEPVAIELIITDEALTHLPQMWAGLSTFKLIDEFKVGEGGWISTAGGPVPRTPNPALTDLDVLENPGNYPADSQGSFAKALGPGDMGFDVGTKALTVTCSLDFGEFNDDGVGNSPQIYEIGLFSDHPTAGRIMVAYGTFPAIGKTVATAPVFECVLTWSRP